MKIELTKTLPKAHIAVFVLKVNEKIETHPFFASFKKEDQQYLTRFTKKVAVKVDFADRLILPSGREVFLIGNSEKSKYTHRKSLLAARRVVVLARKERIKNLLLCFEDFLTVQSLRNPEEFAEVLATQWEMANFEFVKYKTAPQEGWFFVENLAVYARRALPTLSDAFRRGKIIGEEVNKARELSNIPGGDMTPKKLGEAAVKAGRQAGFRVKTLGERQMRKLKMGGILGVAKGSTEKPRFIVMEYRRGGKSDTPVVLVGKGVTFDTGGLNLKPEQAIYEMHMDMSGGAAVIHALAALARLKAKKNVIGLVPAVENMPSGSSYHPGDQLKTMSGKTIEVLNTDAEGRIVLADALTYAKKYKPRLVIDTATLTGAAEVALGQRMSALLTPEPKLEEEFQKVGEEVGDYVWPLPLWEEYEEDIKGTFGDVANTGKTKYGGAITAAAFLWQFVKDSSGRESYPWVHIDIAPRMTSIEGEYLAKGAAGASIALLVNFLRKF